MEPIPQWIIPPTLLSPLTPTSRQSLNTCVHYERHWMHWTQTVQTPPSSVSFSRCLYLSFLQMAVNAQTHARTCAFTHTHVNKHTYTYSAHTCTHSVHPCTNTQDHPQLRSHTGLWTSSPTVTHTQKLTHTRTFRYLESQGSGRIFCVASVWHKQLFILHKMGYHYDEPCGRKECVPVVCDCCYSSVTYCTCFFSPPAY